MSRWYVLAGVGVALLCTAIGCPGVGPATRLVLADEVRTVPGGSAKADAVEAPKLRLYPEHLRGYTPFDRSYPVAHPNVHPDDLARFPMVVIMPDPHAGYPILHAVPDPHVEYRMPIIGPGEPAVRSMGMGSVPSLPGKVPQVTIVKRPGTVPQAPDGTGSPHRDKP